MHLFYKSTALLLAAKGLAIASPYILKIVVDTMSVPGAMDFKMAAAGILLVGLTRVSSTAFQEWRMMQIARLIQDGVRRVATRSFEHMHTLDLNFHKVSSKNIVFGINRALRSIESGLRFAVGFFAPIAFEFILLCGMLQFYCGPLYLANMLATLALYARFTSICSKKRVVYIRDRKNTEKKQEFAQNESIMNYETVKVFGNEPLEQKKYQHILDSLMEQAKVVQQTLSQLNIGQTFIFSTGLTVNLLMAAHDVSTGAMTTGDFVMIQALFLQLSGPLFNMGTFFREIDQSSVDIEDLFHMLKQQPIVKEAPNAKDFEYKSGAIQFQDLTFSHYSLEANKGEGGEPAQEMRERTIFKNFSLDIEPGTTNAIVGQSGFGKTTLLNLLFRIYDPGHGRILIDGQDLKDLTFSSFRKYVSIVPQNGILFNDTILFNLQYGNPDATFEEIVEVAKKCEIHETIMRMPDGYATHVGDLGGKLSGGERQRVLIARGLLKKDAQIFLFDEATSNLDSYTEMMITNELDEIMKGKTVIYCAHRLSSIINVDKIHVLKDGCVHETGTHHELLNNEDSVFSEMWYNYLRESTVDDVAAAVVA